MSKFRLLFLFLLFFFSTLGLWLFSRPVLASWSPGYILEDDFESYTANVRLPDPWTAHTGSYYVKPYIRSSSSCHGGSGKCVELADESGKIQLVKKSGLIAGSEASQGFWILIDSSFASTSGTEIKFIVTDSDYSSAFSVRIYASDSKVIVSYGGTSTTKYLSQDLSTNVWHYVLMNWRSEFNQVSACLDNDPCIPWDEKISGGDVSDEWDTVEFGFSNGNLDTGVYAYLDDLGEGSEFWWQEESLPTIDQVKNRLQTLFPRPDLSLGEPWDSILDFFWDIATYIIGWPFLIADMAFRPSAKTISYLDSIPVQISEKFPFNFISLFSNYFLSYVDPESSLPAMNLVVMDHSYSFLDFSKYNVNVSIPGTVNTIQAFALCKLIFTLLLWFFLIEFVVKWVHFDQNNV